MSVVYRGEAGYIALLNDVLQHGVDIPKDRTGVGRRAIFDAKYVVDEGDFPFSTIRSIPTRLGFEEVMFFLRGRTQTKELEAKGVHYWAKNTSRKFLDNRGLNYLPEGSMGQAYGFQYRNFGGDLLAPEYTEADSMGFDQLLQLVDGLSDDTYGSRHLVSYWNPLQSCEMAILPCFYAHQFMVVPNNDGSDTLHLKLLSRSCDLLFGLQLNLQGYRIYQMALCKLYGFKLGRLSVDFTHTHIYLDQIEYIQELLTRDFGEQGVLKINKNLETLEDLLALSWEDIEISGLKVNKTPFVTPRPEMAE